MLKPVEDELAEMEKKNTSMIDHLFRATITLHATVKKCSVYALTHTVSVKP